MLAELRNVTKTYRAGDPPVLKECNLEVDDSQTVAIVGPSGSGKSTLLNLLGALDKPDAGEVHVAGKNLGSFDAEALAAFRNTTVGFIFQLHHLLPQCTVLENILVPTLADPKADPKALAARARHLIEAVGLTPRIDHRPGQLSGGERQRAAVARALIQSPKLLLADEPTGALDHANATRLTDLLAEINTKERVAIVMVTHAPDLARRMKGVLELRDGKLFAQ
jgi:lipoprotein-releasing system ATP-binding protein